MIKHSRKKTASLAIGILGFVGLAVAGHFDEGNRSAVNATHEKYCGEVAVWQAEEARGIPAVVRTGHGDWRGIAEDHCPGLRPAW
jgi:hypothetical protein